MAPQKKYSISAFVLMIIVLTGCMTMKGPFQKTSALPESHAYPVQQANSLFVRWNTYESNMRDENILPEAARKEFYQIYPILVKYASDLTFSDDSHWFFPVVGSSRHDLYKNDYQPNAFYGLKYKGFIYFDPKHHGGHPAYDIFTHDADQNCLDDRTGKRIYILAPVDLLILTAQSDWTTNSWQRGGRYIWALHPPSNTLYYFAHLDNIIVQAGQYVAKGAVIATMGRTGNARPKRSATHLHLMLLKVSDTNVTPIDYWSRLTNARVLDVNNINY